MATMLWQRLASWTVLGGLLIGLLAVGGISEPCAAATISYGNVGPVAGVTFLDVTESSGTDPVPLFGPPTAYTLGLDFDPMNFVSTANGGAMDVTDGQLNFGILTGAGGNIPFINVLEAGDFSLTGTGTSATQVLAGVIIRATVLQVNGANVAPFDLTPANASLSRNLTANPGIVQPWQLSANLNVAAQTVAKFGANARATRVEVVINNQLQAHSQTSSLAFIAKKEFRVDLQIPEPATLLLMLGGCLGLVAAAGRMAR
jgi:hypothetical protein